MNDLPVRKHPRLKGCDYSQNGAYFITFCVKGGHEMLGTIVGRDVLIAPCVPPPITDSSKCTANHDDIIAPCVQLSEYGIIVDKHIKIVSNLHKGLFIDKYIIMPNYIHMIIVLENIGHGAMKTSRPTNAIIPSIIRSLKGMITKEVGFSLWQTSYHDHIIRNEAEYYRIWKYIDENPVRWQEDCYFMQYN